MPRILRSQFPRTTALALVLMALAFASCGRRSDQPKADTPAARVIVGDVARVDSLLGAARGKWVLLNIWATWCKPCVAEAPDLVSLAGSLAGRPFALIGVSMDLAVTDDESAAVRKVTEFVRGQGITYPNLIYSGGTDELVSRFNLSGVIPVSILYDPQGKEAARWVGVLRDADLGSIRAQVR